MLIFVKAVCRNRQFHVWSGEASIYAISGAKTDIVSATIGQHLHSCSRHARQQQVSRSKMLAPGLMEIDNLRMVFSQTPQTFDSICISSVALFEHWCERECNALNNKCEQVHVC